MVSSGPRRSRGQGSPNCRSLGIFGPQESVDQRSNPQWQQQHQQDAPAKPALLNGVREGNKPGNPIHDYAAEKEQDRVADLLLQTDIAEVSQPGGDNGQNQYG